MAEIESPRAGTVRQPRYRIRINIQKQSKAYVYETTIEADWEGDWETIPTPSDVEDELTSFVLDRLNSLADTEARWEIARREALDAEKAAVS